MTQTIRKADDEEGFDEQSIRGMINELTEDQKREALDVSLQILISSWTPE